MLWFSKSLEEPQATLEPIFSHVQPPVEGQPELWRAALSKAEVPTHAKQMDSLLAADRESTELNMEVMSVTLEVSKLSGWLKARAAVNMKRILLTLDVSQLNGWLNPCS